MTLRNYSDEDKSIHACAIHLRNAFLKDLGVKRIQDLSVDQMSELINRVKDIPGYMEYIGKNTEAFRVQKGIENRGGFN